jgi:anti-anti-sigma factor
VNRRPDPEALPPRIVTLTGDIDTQHTPRIGRRIAAAIRASRGCAVIVDCTAVTFLETRGLAMMSRAQRRAEESACPLIWRGLNADALKTLHVAGLDATLRIET